MSMKGLGKHGVFPHDCVGLEARGDEWFYVYNKLNYDRHGAAELWVASHRHS